MPQIIERHDNIISAQWQRETFYTLLYRNVSDKIWKEAGSNVCIWQTAQRIDKIVIDQRYTHLIKLVKHTHDHNTGRYKSERILLWRCYNGHRTQVPVDKYK